MPNPIQSPSAWSRAGATAETFSREFTQNSFTPVSGTLYLSKMPVQNANFNNIVSRVAGTGKTGGTHGWMVVLDPVGNVLAVTSDATDAATTWGSPFAEQSLPCIPPYQSYYGQVVPLLAGFCIVATGMPTMISGPALASATLDLPVLTATGGAGFTTPPVVGTKLALSSNGNQPWLYTT
jgi:hypothetical protein